MTVEEDLIGPVAHKHGVDEFLSIYTSKIEVKHWVRAKALYLSDSKGLPVWETREILREYSRALLIIGKKNQPAFMEAIQEMEQMLANNGFYKTFIFTLHPDSTYIDAAASGIDIVGTVKKFKKEFDVLVPVAIILVE